MPGLFFQPIRRRDFLKRSGQTLLAGMFSGALVRSLAAAAGDESRLHLALLSDTYVAADLKTENRKFLPAENLKLVVSQVMQAQPQAVLLNGDAARLSGEVEDYEAVKALLGPAAVQCPIAIGLGNHDHRENFLKVFTAPPGAAQKVADKHVLVLEQPFLRVILLDSLLYVNKVAGLLGKSQRDWLDQYLARVDGRPTVLFVHHTLGNGDGELLDAEALFRIIQPYAKVKAIFYGHSHEYSFRQYRGIHLVNLPAVGYNFADKEPVGWVDAFFSATGVDLTLKAFGGNRQQDGQTTNLVWRTV
jgi:3',5'-cyclic AMP phosphodiesterase CpdA